MSREPGICDLISVLGPTLALLPPLYPYVSTHIARLLHLYNLQFFVGKRYSVGTAERKVLGNIGAGAESSTA